MGTGKAVCDMVVNLSIEADQSWFISRHLFAVLYTTNYLTYLNLSLFICRDNNTNILLLFWSLNEIMK